MEQPAQTTGTAVEPRRPATDAEARALASSLRLQILRMVLDDALTNQEIAQRLGRNPASVLHHVRTLVDTGFLEALETRRGVRGSREIPYRSTRKSWYVEVCEPGHGTSALIQAFIEESSVTDLHAAKVSRLGLRLTDEQVDELEGRLQGVLDEYAVRAPTAGGRPWSLFLAIHPDPNRD
jgi:predicted transcriptional regulator